MMQVLFSFKAERTFAMRSRMETPTRNKPVEARQNVVILFAGDSGDGIQLTGSQFTDTNALFGNDVSTFPNYPAPIRRIRAVGSVEP